MAKFGETLRYALEARPAADLEGPAAEDQQVVRRVAQELQEHVQWIAGRCRETGIRQPVGCGLELGTGCLRLGVLLISDVIQEPLAGVAGGLPVVADEINPARQNL